jgi:predicted transglutaminase-like protease
MRYRVLADIVVVTHLFWIFFLIVGAYWGRKHRAVMAVHGAGLVFAVVSQIFGWYCPLTHLEVWLAAKENTALAYPGSFVAHYAEKLVYINVAPAIISVFTLVLVGVTVWIYWRAFKKAGHIDR